MFFPISAWFPAFLLTLAIEAPIVAFMLRRGEPNLVRLGVLILFANLATHLAVWYVITQLLLVGTLAYTVVAETWAIAAEAVFYRVAIRGLSTPRAIAVALVANGASFLVGRAIGGSLPEMLG
jgi:hypothetical protein